MVTVLINHFFLTLLCFILSCRDTSEWKAFPIKATVCKILMIDVSMKEVNCEHKAKCLNFYFYTVSFRPKK